MSSPTPSQTPVANAPTSPATSHGAQVVLGVFLAIVVGLLAFRGYANHLGARPTEPAKADLIDLNTANPSELAQVPGVGPKTAEAIVDHRRLHGPFKSVDELKNVHGIGPITFERTRDSFRASELPQQYPQQLSEVPPSPNPTPTQPPLPRATHSAKKIQPGETPINVNTASADDLQRLPGVGPVTAQAIVAERTTSPFQSVSDLDKVKGIGPKTLEKLRPFVVVK